jgi:hypothetical protein
MRFGLTTTTVMPRTPWVAASRRMGPYEHSGAGWQRHVLK